MGENKWVKSFGNCAKNYERNNIRILHYVLIHIKIFLLILNQNSRKQKGKK